MKNSADLGGCDPPRPSASVDNTLLDLQNSSYPTHPHSIIAKYISGLTKKKTRILYPCGRIPYMSVDILACIMYTVCNRRPLYSVYWAVRGRCV